MYTKHLGQPDYINFAKAVSDKISFGSGINEITSTSNMNINPTDTLHEHAAGLYQCIHIHIIWRIFTKCNCILYYESTNRNIGTRSRNDNEFIALQM